MLEQGREVSNRGNSDASAGREDIRLLGRGPTLRRRTGSTGDTTCAHTTHVVLKESDVTKKQYYFWSTGTKIYI